MYAQGNMLFGMLFGKTPTQMDTALMFTNGGKDNKMWCISIVEYGTTDKRNKLDLIISVEKS